MKWFVLIVALLVGALSTYGGYDIVMKILKGGGGGGLELQPSLKKATMLVVMVKDEGRILHRLLSSFREYVADYLLICDTGSTDNTTMVARQFWPAAKLLIHDISPFVNFEHNRNLCNNKAVQLLASNDNIEWVALADADYIAYPSGVASSSKPPSADINMIQIFPGSPGHPHNSLYMLYSRRIFPSCRYRLWTHEFLDCSAASTQISYGFFNGFRYVDMADGKSRPEKLTRDERLLRQWLQERNETDIRPRALYYLARCIEDQGERYPDAIEAYQNHLKEEQHTNYQFYSVFRIAMIALKSGNSNETEARFMDAIMHDWSRREPYYYLARYYRSVKRDYKRCWLYGAAGFYTPSLDYSRMPLFVETAIYEWGLQEELAYCLLMLGRADVAKDHYGRLIRDAHSLRIPEENLKLMIDIYKKM
jgi:glycosyltransferase involved in cell wall biosynthesis